MMAHSVAFQIPQNHMEPSRRGLGKLLGDTAAVTAMLNRLLHHAHVPTCGPRSWRTRVHSEGNSA